MTECSHEWNRMDVENPAEAAVHIVNRELQSLEKESSVSYNELQTALCIVNNLSNLRPIDARMQSGEDCIYYITPNSLLLGGVRGECKTFDLSSYPFSLDRTCERKVAHDSKRLAVRDNVWLSDQNAMRG